MTVLLPRATAALTASNTTAAGSPSGRPDTMGTSIRAAQVSSCSMAAARNVSAAARSGVSPASLNRFASFAAVVVLPLPFTPTTRITRGRAALVRRDASFAASSATSTSRTASSALGTVFSPPVDARSRTCAIRGSTSETERSARSRPSSSSSRNSAVSGSSALRPKTRERNPPRVFARPLDRLMPATLRGEPDERDVAEYEGGGRVRDVPERRRIGEHRGGQRSRPREVDLGRAHAQSEPRERAGHERPGERERDDRLRRHHAATPHVPNDEMGDRDGDERDRAGRGGDEVVDAPPGRDDPRDEERLPAPARGQPARSRCSSSSESLSEMTFDTPPSSIDTP